MNRRPSPLAPRLSIALLGALLIAPLASGPARAADPGQTAAAQNEAHPQPPRGTPEQRQTVTSLRDVGTAMFTWYSEQVERQKIHRTGGSGGESRQVDVTSVPVISAKELEKL